MKAGGRCAVPGRKRSSVGMSKYNPLSVPLTGVGPPSGHQRRATPGVHSKCSSKPPPRASSGKVERRWALAQQPGTPRLRPVRRRTAANCAPGGPVWFAVACALLLALFSPAMRAAAQPPQPGTGPAGSISLTAPDIELAQVLAILSERTGQRMACDPRLSGLRFAILGAEGSAEELLDAIGQATGLSVRRVGRITYVARDALGAAAVAHEYRRRNWPRLSAESGWISTQAANAASATVGRLGLGGAALAPPGLTDQQVALLQQQGFLTVADLFPEYYQPIYDIFGALIDSRSQRPQSLPEFAGTRVFFYPSLQLVLHLPSRRGEAEEGSAPGGPLTWPIELGSY